MCKATIDQQQKDKTVKQIVFSIIITLAFLSCAKKNQPETAGTNLVADTAIVDTNKVDTTAVDSITVDSTIADSVK